MKDHMVQSLIIIILDEFVLQSNFEFYENNEFHKLSQHPSRTDDFIQFQTNIFSLSVKIGNLETLIRNLEFYFSVTVVSETRTPNRKNEFKPQNLEGYQNYYDLDLTYYDADSEFKST